MNCRRVSGRQNKCEGKFLPSSLLSKALTKMDVNRARCSRNIHQLATIASSGCGLEEIARFCLEVQTIATSNHVQGITSRSTWKFDLMFGSCRCVAVRRVGGAVKRTLYL